MQLASPYHPTPNSNLKTQLQSPMSNPQDPAMTSTPQSTPTHPSTLPYPIHSLLLSLTNPLSTSNLFTTPHFHSNSLSLPLLQILLSSFCL